MVNLLASKTFCCSIFTVAVGYNLFIDVYMSGSQLKVDRLNLFTFFPAGFERFGKLPFEAAC